MRDPWSARVINPLGINPYTYPPGEWAADLEVIWRAGRSYALTQQEIEDFVSRKYPDLHELRAERLLAALNFQIKNLPALVEAELAQCNELGIWISWLVTVALYRWLVIVPWPGAFEPPPRDTIIELAKAPWSSQGKADPE